MSDSIPRNNPPLPPPPPPPENPSSKILPVVLKMRSNSPSRFFQARITQLQNQVPAPTGLYFFHGSLQDLSLLVDILNLENAPTLRPAYIKGYRCKLWGHYPALMKGDPEDTVTGTVYEVQTIGDAESLASYEGPSYMTISCAVWYTHSEPLAQEEGHAFLFVGNERDLSEASFDLEHWMKRRALAKGRN